MRKLSPKNPRTQFKAEVKTRIAGNSEIAGWWNERTKTIPFSIWNRAKAPVTQVVDGRITKATICRAFPLRRRHEKANRTKTTKHFKVAARPWTGGENQARRGGKEETWIWEIGSRKIKIRRRAEKNVTIRRWNQNVTITRPSRYWTIRANWSQRSYCWSSWQKEEEKEKTEENTIVRKWLGSLRTSKTNRAWAPISWSLEIARIVKIKRIDRTKYQVFGIKQERIGWGSIKKRRYAQTK